MGTHGPIPKRSDQRMGHRAKDDADDITRITPTEEILGPPLDLEGCHPLASDWYEGLRRSGQADLYQASDWAQARVWTELLSRALKQGSKPSAVLVAAWSSGAAELLSTEGARRRMRLELDRPRRSDPDAERAAASVADIRARLTREHG